MSPLLPDVIFSCTYWTRLIGFLIGNTVDSGLDNSGRASNTCSVPQLVRWTNRVLPFVPGAISSFLHVQGTLGQAW